MVTWVSDTRLALASQHRPFENAIRSLHGQLRRLVLNLSLSSTASFVILLMVKLKNREACYRELLWIFILYILISTAEPSRTKLPGILALVRRRRSLIARHSGSYGGSCSHRDYCIGQSVGY